MVKISSKISFDDGLVTILMLCCIIHFFYLFYYNFVKNVNLWSIILNSKNTKPAKYFFRILNLKLLTILFIRFSFDKVIKILIKLWLSTKGYGADSRHSLNIKISQISLKKIIEWATRS